MALKELITEATVNGTKPLSKYEAEAAMEMARELNYPGFRYNPATDGAIFDNHWEEGPHFHFPGALKSTHIPFVP
jgi:hypothetical protein